MISSITLQKVVCICGSTAKWHLTLPICHFTMLIVADRAARLHQCSVRDATAFTTTYQVSGNLQAIIKKIGEQAQLSHRAPRHGLIEGARNVVML